MTSLSSQQPCEVGPTAPVLQNGKRGSESWNLLTGSHTLNNCQSQDLTSMPTSNLFLLSLIVPGKLVKSKRTLLGSECFTHFSCLHHWGVLSSCRSQLRGGIASCVSDCTTTPRPPCGLQDVAGLSLLSPPAVLNSD